MGSGERGAAPFHPFGTLPTQVVIGVDGSGLLWGPGVGGRQDTTGRGGPSSGLPVLAADRDHKRRRAESPHQEGRPGLSSTPLPSRLWQDRKWRVDPARDQRTQGSRPGRGGLDEELRRSVRRGRRRASCTPGERGRTSDGSGGSRSRPTRGPLGPFARREEGVHEEEEEKEGEDQRGEDSQWSATSQGGAEGGLPAVLRHSPGPQREGEDEGAEVGATVCGSEEGQEVVVVEHRQREQQLLELEQPGHGDGGWGFLGGDEDPGAGGALPRCSRHGNPDADEEELAGHGGGRGRGTEHQAHCSALLPVCPEPQVFRSTSPGTPQHLERNRCPSPGPARPGTRHIVPEAEGPGDSALGHELGRCPAPRTGVTGHHHPHPSRGAAVGSEGDILGLESQVAGYVQPRRERWPEGQRQRQGRREQQRREEGRCTSGQRKRRRQKIAPLPVVAVNPGQGEQDAMQWSAPDASGAGFLNIRESGSASHAPDQLGFLAYATPDTGMVSSSCPDGLYIGDPVPFVDQGHVLPEPCHSVGDNSGPLWSPSVKRTSDLEGLRIIEIGPRVQQWLQEVLPLRSKPTGRPDSTTLFPLPTSCSTLSESFPSLSSLEICWLGNVCLGLNSMWGEGLSYEGTVTPVAQACLARIVLDIQRVSAWSGILDGFDWQSFFSTRSIDYKGDEVKTAREFTWRNIEPALPAEIGRVPLAEVCTLGAKHYVENFESYLRPEDRWEVHRPPRVMVSDEAWPEVCRGLTSCGICTYLTEDDLFHTGEGPLLNGMFGVTKDEFHQGVEVFRLIMNLIPLNGIVESVKGDVETLPTWSMTTPFQLQPDESLVVSSEDVRCFFYVMAVPPSWWKFLGFNKRVPMDCLPPDLQGQTVYLAAKVLPMGFANSVSLAQHVHRNLALWSGSAEGPDKGTINLPEAEIRKDRPATVASPSWRVYLDNYDLLERVKSVDLSHLEGQQAPSILALRQQYEYWEVPRNLKKSVSRMAHAEVQGAQVDGRLGVAYPREAKLLKYLAATFSLLEMESVTQRQVQVVCGGLVYVSMFRRQLLGCLNAVWRFITSFDELGVRKQRLPPVCQLELVRFVGLLPLARLDFRMEFEEQVTCSDASTKGGGICASTSLSRAGVQAAHGKLRGELPELRQEHQVLTVGLFDGIAAVRVAADLIGIQVIGHVSVELSPQARRVVESHFPEVLHHEDVNLVDEGIVQQWARDFSQASLVIVGAGPPCQGVSGLNADRKGALRDVRSSLFRHVKRIWGLVKRHFCWCQVHCLMENVASMDDADRNIMSDEFGEQPLVCDAGTMVWCHRPRLYWISWELGPQVDGVEVRPGGPNEPTEVRLYAHQDLDDICKEGWFKVDPSRSFPTFTTSRPRERPGHKPAGIKSCNSADLDRWVQDKHRYPPYQYRATNLMINKRDEMRLPDIEEKEYMMGFPVGFTLPCLPKASRGSVEHLDVRHSLIGNSWCVPVVAWLLGQLCSPLGLCPSYNPQQIVDFLNPNLQVFLQSRLWRSPLRPIRGPVSTCTPPLASRLGNLVSVKGEDILLSTPSSQLVKFQRLRTSIPSRLWKWKVVSGWRWKGTAEHINALEMRAVLTTLKWRIQHKKLVGKKFMHLVDSLVVLHALSRGRSSSRKLRSTLSRINALLLCSSNQALWGYVRTDMNPADRPSRWGSRARTKFRHA